MLKNGIATELTQKSKTLMLKHTDAWKNFHKQSYRQNVKTRKTLGVIELGQ